MLQLRSTSKLLRSLTVAAMPAMASCFIISGGPSSLAAAGAGHMQLRGPATASARTLVSVSVAVSIAAFVAVSVSFSVLGSV